MDQDSNDHSHCNNVQQTDNNNLASDIQESANINDQNFDSIIGYNEEALLGLIDKAQDLNLLNEIYNNIQTEMQQKVGVLRRIQKENDEIKNNLDSHKCFLSEMEHSESEDKKKTDCLRKQIELRRKEFENLHNQQVDDLEKFENDVRNLSEEFLNSAQKYESPALMEAIMELQHELAEKMSEMAAKKEQLKIVAQGFKEGVVDDSINDISLKILEESINDISSLNEKLTQSVEQLTNKMDSLRIKINTLNFQK